MITDELRNLDPEKFEEYWKFLDKYAPTQWVVRIPNQVRPLDKADIIHISLAATFLNVAIQRGIESMPRWLR